MIALDLAAAARACRCWRHRTGGMHDSNSRTLNSGAGTPGHRRSCGYAGTRSMRRGKARRTAHRPLPARPSEQSATPRPTPRSSQWVIRISSARARRVTTIPSDGSSTATRVRGSTRSVTRSTRRLRELRRRRGSSHSRPKWLMRSLVTRPARPVRGADSRHDRRFVRDDAGRQS